MKKIIFVSISSILILSSCMVSKKSHLKALSEKNTEISNLNSKSDLSASKIKGLEKELENKNQILKTSQERISQIENEITELKNTELTKEFTVTKLVTTNDSLSYFIGNDMIRNLNNSGLTMSISELVLVQGMRDAMVKDKKLLMDYKIGSGIAKRVFQKAQEKRSSSNQNAFKEKIDKGNAFLAKKSAEKDVITLPSGLRYKIITKGTGKIPKKTDKVVAHYHGTLMNGTVFDSSVERGKPFTTNVNQVISGWVEALQLMPVGSKWEIYLAPNLAYGERGAGGLIKPYETLVFQIELLKIVEK